MACRKKTIERSGRLLLFFVIPLLACGPYSFSGNSLPGHIKTVAVPLFVDQTSEFGVREKLTDAVIGEITQDNTLKIANETEADAVIVGKIVSLEDRADTFNREEEVESHRVFITVEVEVQDRKKQSNLWKERWSQWGIYSLSDGPDARQDGIQLAVEKIAEDVLNKTVSGW